MASLLLSRENQKFSSPAAKIPLPPRFSLFDLFSLSGPAPFFVCPPPFASLLTSPRPAGTPAHWRNTRARYSPKSRPPLFCLPASTRPAKTPAPAFLCLPASTRPAGTPAPRQNSRTRYSPKSQPRFLPVCPFFSVRPGPLFCLSASTRLAGTPAQRNPQPINRFPVPFSLRFCFLRFLFLPRTPRKRKTAKIPPSFCSRQLPDWPIAWDVFSIIWAIYTAVRSFFDIFLFPRRVAPAFPSPAVVPAFSSPAGSFPAVFPAGKGSFSLSGHAARHIRGRRPRQGAKAN